MKKYFNNYNFICQLSNSVSILCPRAFEPIKIAPVKLIGTT